MMLNCDARRLTGWLRMLFNKTAFITVILFQKKGHGDCTKFSMWTRAETISLSANLSATILIADSSFESFFEQKCKTLKEYYTDLALHSSDTVTLTMDGFKKKGSSRDIFFISCILLPWSNLAPTLPTMQRARHLFSRGYGCVMIVAAKVALSLKQRWGGYGGLLSSLLSNSTPRDVFHFQTCSPNRHQLKWHHVRQFTRFALLPLGPQKAFYNFFTCAVAC